MLGRVPTGRLDTSKVTGIGLFFLRLSTKAITVSHRPSMLRLLPIVLLTGLFGGTLFLAQPSTAATAYAGEFLAVGAGARASALGNAYVALVDDATAGYWNPAALASVTQGELHFTHADRFSGLVSQDFVALALPRFALFDTGAFSLLRVGVDDIPFTRLQNEALPVGPDNRPLVASTETSQDLAFLLSGGRKLTEALDLGITGKVIYRTVDQFNAYGFGVDLGLRYRLANGLVLAANVHDLTSTPIVWNEGLGTDRIRPSLGLGLAWQRAVGAGMASLSLGSRSGGNAEDSSGAEPVNAGIEYLVGKVALRGGIEEGRQSFGLGLKLHNRLTLDAAYLQHDELESTYFFSGSIGL